MVGQGAAAAAHARTAVEEAGIDIEPPARDLLEHDGPEMEPSPPETSEEPTELVEAVHQAADDTVAATPPEQEPEPSDRLVSWEQAQERLDHERSFDQPAEPGIELRELATAPREAGSATP